MSYLKKLAAICRSCPNADTCPHKKMEAEGYLTNAVQPIAIEDALPSVLVEQVLSANDANINSMYKTDLQREIRKAIYTDFLSKKFNVRLRK